MFTDRQRALFLETAVAASRWYLNNQCTNQNPWGGIAGSADNGRFIYEFNPAEKRGRAAGVWAQAVGIMSLDALSIRLKGEDAQNTARREAAMLAGDYLLQLQHLDRNRPETCGGLAEAIPWLTASFPRDGITGAMGLSALYRLTEDRKYLDAAELFADWYVKNACDAGGWPYVNFDFALGKGFFNKNELYREAQGHNSFVKGDWQIGGALFFYQLAKQTGKQKYIDEYMLPMVRQLAALYEKYPVTEIVHGFHGFHPVCFGNDDFALVTMLCAFCASGDRAYYDMARERIIGQLAAMDECGSFPSYGGTFVMAITIKVLLDLQAAMGVEQDRCLVDALTRAALYGVELQAFDYKELRVHGGFWGQTEHGVGRHTIHQRSTGYALILYSMLAGNDNLVPYYNCLNWGYAPNTIA